MTNDKSPNTTQTRPNQKNFTFAAPLDWVEGSLLGCISAK